ncbi:conjugal transfer protein TraG [Paracoccus denitrificans]|jgi:type IV secretion system protein VirD4|uniref:TRAG family protein n=1 Tax=Paracoccus denitrificans (strain Pd 1222) TaxID=318586 RepID=A1B262_PARDP|nr:conjugal transfer protein TraG [Paracoccus denitrificans]ABL69606.1 TRAG family protein [Paracoccus denitrificans PD1222]MBB4626855.1 type IV secretion system protein VirD4 [Paracoccus denitrificans]MCU7427662.1 conjugal transfer protein TraG [Paracoccus denitrificans]QAR24926.1 conjugal transfer protein TraG [Paracoccus denitrificans]UPV93899.1 conjugal transfer protein TraG [Paracoccus denitrificans]
MSATKILWGQISIVFLIILATTWGATQYVAASLRYQAQLGPPWFVLFGTPVYYPPAIFWWWYFYEAYAPPVFATGGIIAASGGIIAIGVAIAMSVWRAREARNVATYGSARWAERGEVKAAGLLDPDGVVLGRYEREYLRHDGPEHVLCFAPTRSGKGVGLVVPSLLAWPGSAIVHDIKGENWQLTAGFRARYGRVLLFDPTNPNSSAYNPLLEVRRGEWEVRDVQNIADILVDPEGSLERRNHWEKTSHSLLVGAILHVLYAEKDKTLAGVANFLSDPRRPVESTLRAMMRTSHLGEAGPHPVVASAARELLNKSENERSGVLSTAMSFLGLYRDPVVSQVTRRCDWRIGDIVGGVRPVTLYLVVPPSDISRTKPLIRLILNQIGRRLTEDLQGKDDRHRLLLMLDEFPALGRLDFFESALAFMAGYGLKSFLIAQSLNQIEKAYGPNNSILDNCHVRVSFATNDERTAKRVSDALGTATEMKAMKNYAGHRLAPWLSHLMVSRSETARALLTPGEIMQLPPTDEIVMVAGTPPIRATKARYYEDTRFAERVLPPPNLVDVGASGEDDWSSLAVPVQDDEQERVSDMGAGDEDPTASERRLQPELAQPQTVDRQSPFENEFEFDPPEDEEDGAIRNQRIMQQMRGVARQVSLNPDDGMEL